jgi:hypothetical protein
VTAQQLIGVGVRLFAVWLALTSFPYLVTIPGQLAGSPGLPGGAPTVSYGIGIVYLLAAVALWVFPLVVANRLLPRSRHTNHLTFQAHDLARVGCSLLGLWFFAKALPNLAWFLFRAFLFAGSSSNYTALDSQARLDLAMAAFELAFAVLVIARAGAFATLVVSRTQRPAAVDADATDESGAQTP